MEIVAVAVFLILGGIVLVMMTTPPFEPVKLHTDDCDICQEDMRASD